MRKIVICLSLLFPLFLQAQNEYVQMKNCSNLCFIPAAYSAGDIVNLHILQREGVGIYDENISLIKTIVLDSREFVFQSSRTRTRSVEGVERSSIVKVDEITKQYADFAAGQGLDFATLTLDEKKSVVIEFDRQFNADVEMRTEDEFTIFISRNYIGNNYFCYRRFMYEYPKSGVLLDKDGKLYSFRAAYRYNYSAWSDYIVNYDTIRSENDIIACNYIGTHGIASNRFYVSSTLFNEDELLEYIRPVYALVDGPVFSIITPDDPDEPVTNDGEYTAKELALCGIEIVSENGTVLGSISFGKEYDEIGNYQFANGNIFSIGDGVSVFQLGDNRFISFDTVDNEDGITSIYKHFYKINLRTNSVEAVNEPACIKVFRNDSHSIDVEYAVENDAVAELVSLTGAKSASQKIGAGVGNFRMSVKSSGTYILTLSENGAVISSQKIFIK